MNNPEPGYGYLHTPCDDICDAECMGCSDCLDDPNECQCCGEQAEPISGDGYGCKCGNVFTVGERKVNYLEVFHDEFKPMPDLAMEIEVVRSL